MCKELKDMTLAELWKLFPITLTTYNPDWSEWADEEILVLSTLLRNCLNLLRKIYYRVFFQEF